MTRILLARHGVTDDTQARRYGGRMDVPLNEEGRRQAALLGKRLAGERIDRAFSSDLARARQTAEIVLAGRPLKAVADPRLRELHFGLWEGLTHEDILSRHGPAYREWLGDPLLPVPSGESIGLLQDRVLRCLEEIRHDGETILVVTHGGPIAVLLCSVEKMPLKDYGQRIFPPASLSGICIEGSRRRLVFAGETGHLTEAVHG